MDQAQGSRAALARTAGPGMVIWITGLSGAGKSTVARLLRRALEERGHSTVLLDGDELRAVFPGGDRFDRESRLKLALSYGRLCRLLAAQGLSVICATISMRREVYRWNRENLPRYCEVFLDVDAEIRRARDPKGHYARLAEGALGAFAGADQEVDSPPAPHVHLRPARDEPAEATAARILAFVLSRLGEEAPSLRGERRSLGGEGHAS